VLRGSALWNIAIVVRHVLGATSADADVRGRAVLADVGLSDVAAADARTLSTGQRQRLALARALACEPQALFLDEPFANVDADGRPALRELVRSYTERSGCALLLATSSLADAAALCKDAVLLRNGAVAHEGAVVALPAADDSYVKALFSDYRVTS
jgi:ABC-type multidrug transport system ATPase subunit